MREQLLSEKHPKAHQDSLGLTRNHCALPGLIGSEYVHFSSDIDIDIAYSSSTQTISIGALI